MKQKKKFNFIPLIFLFFIGLSIASHFIEHFSHNQEQQVNSQLN